MGFRPSADLESAIAAQRTITAQRTGAGIVAGLLLLALVAVADVVLGAEFAFSFFGLLAILSGTGLVFTATAQRRARVVLDDEGIASEGGLGQRNRRYRWDELLEVGWHGPGRLPWWARIMPSLHGGNGAGCQVLIRPQGDRFAVPGPNSPAPLAILAIFGAEAEAAARSTLQAECERHGVPFSDRGLLMLDDPPPGSPLRSTP